MVMRLEQRLTDTRQKGGEQTAVAGRAVRQACAPLAALGRRGDNSALHRRLGLELGRRAGLTVRGLGLLRGVDGVLRLGLRLLSLGRRHLDVLLRQGDGLAVLGLRRAVLGSRSAVLARRGILRRSLGVHGGGSDVDGERWIDSIDDDSRVVNIERLEIRPREEERREERRNKDQRKEKRERTRNTFHQSTLYISHSIKDTATRTTFVSFHLTVVFIIPCHSFDRDRRG